MTEHQFASTDIKRVLINGHKDSLNNGNMLMVLGLISGIAKYNQNISFFLLSDLPEIDRVRYGKIPGLTILCRPWSRQVKGTLPALLSALQFLIIAQLNRITTVFAGKRRVLSQNPLHKAFAEADLAIDVSGDDLTTAYGLFSPLQVIFELTVARLYRTKTAITAQSVGPFATPFMKTIAWLLSYLADCVTLRDKDSFTYWQQIRKGHHHPFTPSRSLADLVHLVPMSISNKNGHGPIMVNLSNYACDCLVNRGAPLEQVLALWAEYIGYVQKRTGLDLILLPHTFRPGKGDDRYWHDKLSEMLSKTIRYTKINASLTTREIQERVMSSSFVISARMHLALTAMRCGVPFLATAYSHKYRLLIPSSLNNYEPVIFLNHYRTPEAAFIAMMDRFDLLWKERLEFRKNISAASMEAEPLAAENIDTLFKLMKTDNHLKKETGWDWKK